MKVPSPAGRDVGQSVGAVVEPVALQRLLADVEDGHAAPRALGAREGRAGHDLLRRRAAQSARVGHQAVVGKAQRAADVRLRAGRTTTSGYDAASRLTSVRYSSGTPKDSTYTYDVDDQLTAMTDGTGRSTWDYDSLGRMVASTNARGQTSLGRMVASTNARGQTLGYGYDQGDQLTSLDYPDALTALNKTTGAGGDPVATGVRRGYDADGHLTSVADWLDHTTRFGYDADGNLQRTERPNATVSTQTTDPHGQITELADTDDAAGTVLRAGERFPQSVREEALEENPSTCVFCRMETDRPQVDQAVPRSRGGDATIDNAQTACPHCNASKRDRAFPANPPPGYRGRWPPS